MLAPTDGSLISIEFDPVVVEFTENVLFRGITDTWNIGESALAAGDSESVTCE
jgi:hypothetical protein